MLSVSRQELLAKKPEITSEVGIYAKVILVTLLAAVVIYIVLPLLGVPGLKSLFLPQNLWLLAGVSMFVAFYTFYWEWIVRKKELLFGICIVGFPVINYISVCLSTTGISLPVRVLTVPFILFPSLMFTVSLFPVLYKRFPFFKFFLAFLIWITFYYFFYNVNYTFQTQSALFDQSLNQGLIALPFVFNILGSCLSIGMTFFLFQSHNAPRQLFYKINTLVAIYCIALAVSGIIGYQAGYFVMDIEGVKRFSSIFAHPNPCAFNMGLLSIYMFISYFTSLSDQTVSMKATLFLTAALATLLCVLLTLSKTIIIVYFVCMLFFLLLNIRFFAQMGISIAKIKALIIPSVIAIGVIIALSGQGFMELFSNRFDNDNSYNWRLLVWENLLKDIDSYTLFLGHGFTSATEKTAQLLFSDSYKESTSPIYPHNIFIQFIYEFGMGSLAFILVFISLALESIKKMNVPNLRYEAQIMYSGILCFCLYYIVFFYFNNLPPVETSSYWLLISILAVTGSMLSTERVAS